MRAILVHGLGRTPLSMLVLAARLKAAGLKPSLFGYVAATERYAACADRLVRFIDSRAESSYILIGHSLGACWSGAFSRACAVRRPRAF